MRRSEIAIDKCCKSLIICKYTIIFSGLLS
jgi:hypothetical protein